MIDKKLKKLVNELSSKYEFTEGIKRQLLNLNQFENVAMSSVDIMSISALALLKNVAKVTSNTNVMKLEKVLENELLKIKEEKSALLHGKIICIEAIDSDFTIGKIYEVKKGILTDNYGNYYGKYTPFQDLQEVNESIANTRFIKLVE